MFSDSGNADKPDMPAWHLARWVQALAAATRRLAPRRWRALLSWWIRTIATTLATSAVNGRAGSGRDMAEESTRKSRVAGTTRGTEGFRRRQTGQPTLRAQKGDSAAVGHVDGISYFCAWPRPIQAAP